MSTTETPPFTAPTKICPHCAAQAQTVAPKCPACGKKYKKKQRVVLKVVLGVFLGFCLLIGGCVAVLGAGVDQAQKENDRAGITAAQFASIEQGTAQADVEAQLGKPQSAQEFEQQIPELQANPSKSSCIYYPESGKALFEGKSFQLCFDEGKLTSKNAY
jgi:hypothetical protein